MESLVYTTYRLTKLINLCPLANYNGSHNHPSTTTEFQNPATAGLTVRWPIHQGLEIISGCGGSSGVISAAMPTWASGPSSPGEPTATRIRCSIQRDCTNQSKSSIWIQTCFFPAKNTTTGLFLVSSTPPRMISGWTSLTNTVKACFSNGNLLCRQVLLTLLPF